MGKKLTVLLISILFASMIMASGYGKWQKELTIEGNIKVIPDPKVLEQMGMQLEDLQLAEEQRIAEELRLAEEQQLFEVQKALDAQKQLELLINPTVDEVTTQQGEPNSEPNIGDNAIETKKPIENRIEQTTESIIQDSNTAEDNNPLDTSIKESEEVKDDKVEKQESKEEITNDDSINNDDKEQSSSNTSEDRVDNSVDTDSAEINN